MSSRQKARERRQRLRNADPESYSSVMESLKEIERTVERIENPVPEHSSKVKSTPKRDLYGMVPTGKPARKSYKKKTATVQPKPSTSHFSYPPVQTSDIDPGALEDAADMSDDSLHSSQKLTRWETRLHKIEDGWKAHRPEIFAAALSAFSFPSHPKVCLFCSKNACLRCQNCQADLCTDHDLLLHQFNGAHDRTGLTPTNFEPLEAEMFINEDGLLGHHVRFPISVDDEMCKKCGQAMEQVSDVKCFVVTMSGRFDLHLQKHVCRANACFYDKQLSIGDIVRNGFWPPSCKVSENMCLFDSNVLNFFSNLKKELPSTSVRGFLESLSTISREHNRVDSIPQDPFSRALREWQRLAYELQRLQGVNDMECPCCSGQMHACHVDGNRKLYRFGYNKQNPLIDYNYFSDVFIDKDEAVENFVSKVTADKIKSDNTCGSSHWKAAKSESRTLKKLDETGMMLVSCRHAVLQKGTNMFRGEIFPYPLYLHVKMTNLNNITFLCQDVACKYFPWLQKLLRKTTDPSIKACGSTKPFLSLMHGKAHVWDCQVKYGGRWQAGAGLTTGEEQETVNSYMSRAGFTTKTMGKGAREEQLTVLALHWNQKKRAKLPLLMQKWKKKAEETILKQEEITQNLQRDLLPPHESFEDWQRELTAIAYSHNYCRSELAKEEELYNAHVKLLKDDAAKSCGLLTEILSNDQRSKLQASYDRLLASLSRADALEVGRTKVQQRQLEEAKEAIEICLSSLSTLSAHRKSRADSSKRRAIYWKRMSVEKTKLKKHVAEYNALAPIFSLDLLPLDDLAAEDLPWIVSTTGAVSLKEKKAAVEEWLLLQRAKEEIELLSEEEKRMLTYIKAERAALVERIRELEAVIEIGGLPSVQNPTSTGYHLRFHTTETACGLLALLHMRCRCLEKELWKLMGRVDDVTMETEEKAELGGSEEICSDDDYELIDELENFLECDSELEEDS